MNQSDDIEWTWHIAQILKKCAFISEIVLFKPNEFWPYLTN